jgi:hypothetical protein
MTSDEPFNMSAHLHGITKVVIEPLNGPYNTVLGRGFKFYRNIGGLVPDFSFIIFGDSVEWHLPDDVFEAELRRRGEEAAAKINGELITLTNLRCIGCNASLSPQITPQQRASHVAIYMTCECGTINYIRGKLP